MNCPTPEGASKFGIENRLLPHKITIPAATTHISISSSTETLQLDAMQDNNIRGCNVYMYAGTENYGAAPANKLNASMVSLSLF